ncbi:MAG TPA: MBL fold metallo-hydrolase [Bryobacteraceae bacterium]|nr:MBL fold metallo-hydrolase [Bryobacteraceae bacterium]
MKLTFWGAAQTVTGSMHQLDADGRRYLLDCGMYQGHRKQAEERNRHFPFPVESVGGVILSHAHIDHSGNLPLLVKNGFSGPIYATPATIDLAHAMLLDTAHIQEKDVEFLNKRHHHSELPVEPLFTTDDAQRTLPLFQPVPYYTPKALSACLSYENHDAGHILGSSTVLLRCTENGREVRLLFSGDVGRPKLPIIRDPDPPPAADYLILESTYGSRVHEEMGPVKDKLADIVRRTAARGGKLIVPAFAVGRVQQLVLLLHELSNEGRVPNIPMFVDSPLAMDVTKVFRDHPECFDEETLRYINDGDDPFGFKRLTFIRESSESKKLNGLHGPCVIISPSGMCEAGRILHHLRNNIEDGRNTILITGFQAENTLGRKLVEKWPEVKIFGEPMRVRAEVKSLQALSAHADQRELLAWMKPLAGSLKKVFLVHGEPEGAAALQKAIQNEYGVETVAPGWGAGFELR